MARVVVTGGAGFLGSHLCEALLQRGDEVIVLDNLITGSVDNIAHLFGRPGFTFALHDVSTYVWVPGDVDVVMHLASPASPKDYLEKPIQTLKVGSLGTHNTLGLAKAKQARYFLASTSEVYGDPEVHPQPETYWGNVNPVGPRGVYDEAKRFAEAMTMAYNRYHGIEVRIVRIFNVYGPRLQLDDGRVVSNFLLQALQGQPITVYGDGSQTRSYCYVDDEIRGFLALLDGDQTGPVNIGNPDTEHSVLDLARMVIDITDSKSEIVFEPLPVDDPTQRRPDITIAATAWGGNRRCPSRTASPAPPPGSGSASAPEARGVPAVDQTSRASASARWSRYQSTVRRRPSSKGIVARKPKRSRARLASTRRRGWPSGLDESHWMSPSNPTTLAISSTSWRIGISSSAPRFTGSAPS
jgi:dTDP-glucose 4,6-dehydratase